MNRTKILSAVRGLTHIQVLALFLLSLMAVGTTAGFLISKDTVTNRFSAGYNTAGIVEKYDPPGSISSGKTVTKEVAVKNEGSVPCYVRVLIEVADADTASKLTLNLNSTDWTAKQPDGYYYYRNVLASGNITEPLLKSVTANSNLDDYKIICYNETVQSYGFNSAHDAFAAVR